ncbi:class I SAM-dependent methyltransferase [Hoeflea sp.]|uniref:class I SAM-dependent methyltransferase n=1 Tax=Hoeflea sp. TaxID=1940281 RepID=UPI0019A6544B|nr:class I SAM-dependent methyltransferase [Hoeflea sp.]MBC7280724.1 class I SAM-dependent methyltransferase [Hoeflea sp.]
MSGQDSANTTTSGLLHAKAWAEAYELIDLQLSPLGLRAIDALDARAGEVVLDIGCGTGQTLLQLAGRVGVSGQVIGVDLAPLLLDIAARRTASLGQVSLRQADATFLDLPSASVDAVFSRFGVMAFANAVAAFSNFYRMLRPSGKLAFTCWRSFQDNELDQFPLLAAGFASPIDERPFSLADPDHICATLEASGFSNITIQSHDENVSSGDVDAMTSVLSRVGPLGKIIRENPALRANAEHRLREALSALGVDPAVVQLRASVWIASARA